VPGQGQAWSPRWRAAVGCWWEQAELPGSASPGPALSQPTMARDVSLLRCGAKAMKVKKSFSPEKENCTLEREVKNVFP